MYTHICLNSIMLMHLISTTSTMQYSIYSRLLPQSPRASLIWLFPAPSKHHISFAPAAKEGIVPPQARKFENVSNGHLPISSNYASKWASLKMKQKKLQETSCDFHNLNPPSYTIPSHRSNAILTLHSSACLPRWGSWIQLGQWTNCISKRLSRRGWIGTCESSEISVETFEIRD